MPAGEPTDFISRDVRIAFLDVAPTGPDREEPVLLLHGFASSGRVNWVDTGWTGLLADDGRRVVAPDHRGHGASDKPHDAGAYAPSAMAGDARRLLDHLGLDRVDVIGYSMGARIAAFLALAEPARVRSVVFGGLGIRMVEGETLPSGLARAMEAESLQDLTDPTQRLFRRFADAGGNDLAALAACIRGSRQNLRAEDIGGIACPALVAVGTKDAIAGDPHRLAALLPLGRVLDIPGRDHNPAVGDRVFKQGALGFLAGRP